MSGYGWLIAAFAMFTSSTAFACVESPEQKEASFKKADVDQDGALSEQEYGSLNQKNATLLFRNMDTNHDSSVSKDEYMKFDPWEGSMFRPKC